MMRTMEQMPPTEDPEVNLKVLRLPDPPESEEEEVKAWEEPVDMMSYLPAAPDLNPMFLEKRVYQGSSGDVYPLPLIDRVATEPAVKAWKAIHIENRYIRLMILPEIGGRIHIGLDKTTGYDFFYRQNTIKPALVGLAGPWVSGGVEFNWPQHHRPATFLPVETEIQRHEDGSVTVWCSDYDRASGMKGMHGVCLHPDRAIVELKVRLYNGTESMQTFLWWANVAARVHQDFQSFFPPDVRHVADHARRAISTFPLAESSYYGVDYGARALHGVPEEQAPSAFIPNGYPPNDLSRYANIPVPTSYMIVQTEGDFFGGYDHAAKAGFVHVANRHIAPGKKQWTWGNHDFGYAWDRSLTDGDGPYVELMAGVYTDNQPDFSYIAPGETKTFSQFWYPLRNSGVPLAANLDAAIRLEVADGAANLAVCVARDLPDAIILLKHANQVLEVWEQDLAVESGFASTVSLPKDCDADLLSLELRTETGRVLACSLAPLPEKPAPVLAVEPSLPEAIPSADELYLTGLHLEQYRHATRSPEPYWMEALRRDPSDVRSNLAMAKAHLKRGEYALAEALIRTAIARATRLNGNPYDGEIFYTLGLVLRRLDKLDEAYAAFYKSTWNAAWRSAGYHAVAEIDAVRGDIHLAIEHLELSLKTNADNLNARNLFAALLLKAGKEDAAHDILAHTSDLDRLDLWSRFLDDVPLPENGHQLLALGLQMERAGEIEEAIDVFKAGLEAPNDGAAPLLHLAISRCSKRADNQPAVDRHLQAAADASPDLCFPSNLDQFGLLEYGLALLPQAARLHHYLGNFLYHKRRHEEAIQQWELAAELDPSCAQTWRNLGIAYFNVRRDGSAAQTAFGRALATAPHDSRLLYESDQLQKRLGGAPDARLKHLLNKPSMVESRDDLSVELASLFNQTGQPAEALKIVLSRQFQPWEGGEGLVLAQYTEAHLELGKVALATGRLDDAVDHFTQALLPPASLGEARHLLANNSHIYYWLGEALAARKEHEQAEAMYESSAAQLADFQAMAVQPFSEMTYWSGLSLKRLGREQEADRLFESMKRYAEELEQQTANIDYFATSLPTLLLFEEDLDARLKTHARLLRSIALSGLGEHAQANSLIEQVLNDDPNNLFAIHFAKQTRTQAVAHAGSTG